MKCTLELYGKSYESTEFTERQVTSFIAASCGATGINIRDLFQSLINFKGLEGKGFRDYNSIESAERDLSGLLKKVFPTLDRHIDSLDTEELILIVTPMLGALKVTPKSLAVVPVEAIEPEPITEVVPFDWEYPTTGIDQILSSEETAAIAYTSKETGTDESKINCWFQWWKAVNDGEKVTPAVAISVLLDFTSQFTEVECDRYYVLTEAYLQNSVPIAA